MERIDNPMTMYFAGDEKNPDSPFFIDEDGLGDDLPEWDQWDYDDYKYHEQKDYEVTMYDLVFS